MQHPNPRADASRSRLTTTQLVGQAEVILKPLLGKQPGTLARLESGEDAVSFEFSGLGRPFVPRAGTVLAQHRHQARDTHGEFEHYYVLDVQGHLVRLSVHFQEACLQGRAFGAIYTGPDMPAARGQALAHLKRLSQ